MSDVNVYLHLSLVPRLLVGGHREPGYEATCIYAFLVLNNKLHIYNFSTWIDTVRKSHMIVFPALCLLCR